MTEFAVHFVPLPASSLSSSPLGRHTYNTTTSHQPLELHVCNHLTFDLHIVYDVIL